MDSPGGLSYGYLFTFPTFSEPSCKFLGRIEYPSSIRCGPNPLFYPKLWVFFFFSNFEYKCNDLFFNDSNRQYIALKILLLVCKTHLFSYFFFLWVRLWENASNSLNASLFTRRSCIFLIVSSCTLLLVRHSRDHFYATAPSSCSLFLSLPLRKIQLYPERERENGYRQLLIKLSSLRHCNRNKDSRSIITRPFLANKNAFSITRRYATVLGNSSQLF